MSETLTTEEKNKNVVEEVDRIEAWRQQQLEAAGYNILHARAIAQRHTGEDKIDLHYAVELVKPSNPDRKPIDSHLAAEILI